MNKNVDRLIAYRTMRAVEAQKPPREKSRRERFIERWERRLFGR